MIFKLLLNKILKSHLNDYTILTIRMDSDCYISLQDWIWAGQIILNKFEEKNLNSGNYVTSYKKLAMLSTHNLEPSG